MNWRRSGRPVPVGGHAVRRKRPTGRSRRIGLRAVFALGAVALATGGVYWGLTSPTFAVTRIQTGAYRFTDPEALDRTLGYFLGRNLWTLDADEVADSLRTLPWVRDLRVGRRVPGTVTVDFREWRPLAIVADEDVPVGRRDRVWVLSEDGSVLGFPRSLAPAALPTLVGSAPRPEGDGRGLALAPKEAAPLLELFSAIADAGLEAVSPVDFLVVRPEGFAIVLQEHQGRLLVGREDFAARLGRYMAARDHLEPGLDVDLRFADRVTVRHRDDRH